MFDHLISNNNLEEEFERYGLDEAKRKFIKELILGNGNSCSENKQFLFQVVCNKTNGIDVDKWDYFLRDSAHLNLKNTFDYQRLLKYCKVISKKEIDGEKKMHIVFRNKEVYDIYEMFLGRSSLHYRACQHRVSIAIQRMFIDALLVADDSYNLSYNGKDYKLSTAHKDPKVWIQLTDNIFFDILNNTSNNMAVAKRIMENIFCRRLYKLITSSTKFTNHQMEENNLNWVNELTEALEKKLNEKTEQCEEFVVEACSFYFGSDDPFPMKSIYYYTKENTNEITEIDWNDAVLFPISREVAHHVEIFVFCKSLHPTQEVMDNTKKIVNDFADEYKIIKAPTPIF